MGIFLNGLLGPKISPLPSYIPPFSSSKDHSLQFQMLYRLLVQDTAFFISFYPTHTTSLLEMQPNYFVGTRTRNTDEAANPNAGKTVPVRNGINPTNAGKNPPSIFILWANYVFDILIIMLFFSSYASTSLSSCELLRTISSSSCRSKNVTGIVIYLLLDSNVFLSLSF